MDRPRDVIDDIEEYCAAHGSFNAVDEHYYQTFVDLTDSEVEKLTVAVMLQHEKDIHRLAGEKSNPETVAKVSSFVLGVFTPISIGIACFDAFGRFGFYARSGPEPSPEMVTAKNRKLEIIEPIITNTVRSTLPWLLSRDITQSQLPL